MAIERLDVELFSSSPSSFRSAQPFQDLLTKHKAICAEFLEKNYDSVFEEYGLLLHSKNYVTKRQSLKVNYLTYRSTESKVTLI